MDKKYISQRLKRFCGYLAGVVFCASGILKLLDPVGAGLVMKGYLDFLHLDFLDFSAKWLALLFSIVESTIGCSLITGVWRKLTALAAMSLQAFFTILTMLLAIFNPEMDCGCFGEAIKLSHLQTFLKNIVLCLMLVAAFIPLKDLGEPKSRKYASFAVVMLAVIGFATYSWMYIPLKDYTDYRAGAQLSSAEHADTDTESPYIAMFTYEKDGIVKTFDINHLPDSTWTYLSTETIENKDYVDYSVGLSISDRYGTYHDEIAAKGKVMAVSLYDTDINAAKWEDIFLFISNVERLGMKALVLISSPEMEKIVAEIPEEIRQSIEQHLYISDYKTLISLNRSNGGAVYFSDGYLIRKWASRNLPDMEELTRIASTSETEILIEHSSLGNLSFQSFLLFIFAMMLLL